MAILKENPTKQELFDIAYKGVVEQGCQSINGNMCQYSTGHGSKCAVGHLLTESQIRKFEPIGTIAVVARKLKSLTPKWINDNLQLLHEMQLAHDRRHSGKNFVAGFKKEMAVIAKKYNLSLNNVENKNTFNVNNWLDSIVENVYEDIKLADISHKEASNANI